MDKIQLQNRTKNFAIRVFEMVEKLPKGLTINNLNKFVVRHFEDQALSGLKPNSDKTVTKTPVLRLGLVGTRHTGALALMAQQPEVVHVIYCQSLSREELK